MFWLRFAASATAKLQATVVTPTPPLAPMNTSTCRSPVLRGLVTGRRPRPKHAPKLQPSLGANGWVRNSRAPARMQRTSISGSAFVGIHHHGCRTIGADALHQLQSKFRITIQINHDLHRIQFEHPGHFLRAGRIGRKLAHFSYLRNRQALAPGAAIFVRANQSDRQRSFLPNRDSLRRIRM